MSRPLRAAAAAVPAVPAQRPASEPKRKKAADLPRPSWQARPCPAWCGGGHHEADYYADRSHFVSIPEVISLTLHDDPTDQGSAPGRLDLAMWQHYREAEPTIDVTVPKCADDDKRRVVGEATLSLTVAEARALRDGLAALLVLASGDIPAGGAQ